MNPEDIKTDGNYMNNRGVRFQVQSIETTQVVTFLIRGRKSTWTMERFLKSVVRKQQRLARVKRRTPKPYVNPYTPEQIEAHRKYLLRKHLT